MTQSIHILHQTSETVTIRRGDFEQLLEAAEDADDLAALAAHDAEETRLGKEAARRDYLTVDEAERLLNGDSPVKVWREKRGFTQRSLARAAAMQPGYLAEIETGKKPGSLDALRRISTILNVPLLDLLTREQRMREPDHGPVTLKLGPLSAGVAAGRRAAAMQDEPFDTVASAWRRIRRDWPELRRRGPSIWDKATEMPIFDIDDIVRQMEPQLFD